MTLGVSHGIYQWVRQRQESKALLLNDVRGVYIYLTLFAMMGVFALMFYWGEVRFDDGQGGMIGVLLAMFAYFLSLIIAMILFAKHPD